MKKILINFQIFGVTLPTGFPTSVKIRESQGWVTVDQSHQLWECFGFAKLNVRFLSASNPFKVGSSDPLYTCILVKCCPSRKSGNWNWAGWLEHCDYKGYSIWYPWGVGMETKNININMLGWGSAKFSIPPSQVLSWNSLWPVMNSRKYFQPEGYMDTLYISAYLRVSLVSHLGSICSLTIHVLSISFKIMGHLKICWRT